MRSPGVWAPQAGRVEMLAGGRRTPMIEARGGWWSAPDALGHGSDYAFAIDGKGAFPDPRSPWQPQGVHGPSRWVDHGRFEWTDRGWQPPPLSSAVIYEIHVGTFSAHGTFAGVVDHLDHLVGLGITHIELMPVAEFPGSRGWGYDGVDLYAPHHAYGGPDGLKALVDACHRRGLAVLLDVVYNHLGPSGNYLARFGPYFTHRYVTPWGPAFNLDGPESDEVRRFLIDNALAWLGDYHVDGLRLDAVHGIFDMSAVHFLEELSLEVQSLEAHLGRRLVLIAESDLNDPRIVRSRDAGGYGIDAQWSDDFHHALHALLTGERSGYYADFGAVKDLERALTHAFVYDGRYSGHRKRRHGRPATGLSGSRFVACLQNHDQVGNRAGGDRSSRLLSARKLAMAAAILLTSPFVPLLFQGEEWGASGPFLYFTDHAEAELAAAVREGRRSEFAAFGWDPAEIPDPQDPDTFARSRLDWAEPGRTPHDELLRWHRELIGLRRTTAELTDGRREAVAVSHDAAATWLTIRRGRILVICNLADRVQEVPIPPDGPWSVRAASAATEVETGRGSARLEAEATAVLAAPQRSRRLEAPRGRMET